MRKFTKIILSAITSILLVGGTAFGIKNVDRSNKAEDETYLNLVNVKEAGRTFDLSFTASVSSSEEKLLTTCYFWATFDENKPGYVDGYSLSVESVPFYGYYHLYLYEFENGASKDICGGTVNIAYDGNPKRIRMIMDEEKLWVYEGNNNVPVITKSVSMLNKAHTGTKIGFRTAQGNTQLSNVSLKQFTSFPEVMTIRVLLIANSYGEDTNTYVHEIARDYGVNLIIGVMFYPGSSMTEHYYRILNQAKTYQYFKNAGVEKVGASFDDILYDEKWDYVMVNNATSDRYLIGGYRHWPAILEYCRRWVPNAASGLFNCWAFGKYMEGTGNTSLDLLDDSIQKQYEAAVKTTAEFVEKYDIDYVVDSMRLFYYLEHELHMSDSSKMETSIYRDTTCHLNEVGRYMQGCCFVKSFLGLPLVDNAFMPGGFTYYNYGSENAVAPVDEDTISDLQEEIDEFFETKLIFKAPLLLKDTPQKPLGLVASSTKTEYIVGDYLDYGAITCEIIYEDGRKKKVSGFTCSITRKLELSDTVVGLAYKGMQTVFGITVREAK